MLTQRAAEPQPKKQKEKKRGDTGTVALRKRSKLPGQKTPRRHRRHGAGGVKKHPTQLGRALIGAFQVVANALASTARELEKIFGFGLSADEILYLQRRAEADADANAKMGELKDQLRAEDDLRQRHEDEDEERRRRARTRSYQDPSIFPSVTLDTTTPASSYRAERASITGRAADNRRGLDAFNADSPVSLCNPLDGFGGLDLGFDQQHPDTGTEYGYNQS